MKQYTTYEQTARLIESGFEQPKERIKVEQAGVYAWYNPAYSIGELIEMLPKSIKVNECFFSLTISAGSNNWLVEYNDIAFGSQAGVCKAELIDALFDMIIKLKEEGVI